MKTVNETRSNFGPKPSLMKWGYTGLVRPVLTYGAVIWGHSALLKTNIEKLRKLNRLGANTITAVRRSNPTRALEIINSGGIYGVGFADDCCALVGGTNLGYMVQKLQTMLDKLIKWGKTAGL